MTMDMDNDVGGKKKKKKEPRTLPSRKILPHTEKNQKEPVPNLSFKMRLMGGKCIQLYLNNINKQQTQTSYCMISAHFNVCVVIVHLTKVCLK